MSCERLDLDALERMERAATPGPWVEDGTIIASRGEEADATAGPREWITFKTDRAQEDRALYIAVRSALPRLLALARKGEEVEQ